MALIQLGLLEFGFLGQRQFLVEIHRDWVLRNCYQLLATHYIVRRWPALWPGMARDFEALPRLRKASVLRVNLTEVPIEGMPAPFLALYDGLLSHDGLRSGQAPTEVVEALRTMCRVDSVAL